MKQPLQKSAIIFAILDLDVTNTNSISSALNNIIQKEGRIDVIAKNK